MIFPSGVEIVSFVKRSTSLCVGVSFEIGSWMDESPVDGVPIHMSFC